jgi:hypothetical protein
MATMSRGSGAGCKATPGHGFVPASRAGTPNWRIENFPTLDQTQSAAASSPTSLAATVSGKVWLFTLGRRTARRLAAPRSLRSAWCQSSRRPISGADQLRWRSVRLKNAGALTSRLRVILCAGWPGRPTNDARRKPHGSWLVNGRPRSGHAIEIFSSGTTDLDHSDVSAGCDQTGPGAGQA